MNVVPAGRRVCVLLAVTCGALILAATASAHAELSPPVTLAKSLRFFTLAVPTEKEKATTTKIELTLPSGFAVDSFAPSPGWTREVKSTGSGSQAQIQEVTWAGGKVPTGEDSVFGFLASPTSAKTYTFKVRQTYSDGTIIDWAGPESSDTPSPRIEAKASLGGAGNTTLAIVGIALAGVALVVAVAGLTFGSGRRTIA